jgi:hypothetical protein
VSLAAREPVYSAALAWTLEDGSPLSLEQRLAVLASISGARVEGKRVTAKTEWHDLDLLVSIDGPSGPWHLAIENKIKSVEAHQQLAGYDQHLAGLSGTVTKLFLTLTGEAPRSGRGWMPLSYRSLVDALRTHGRSTNHYISDLCDALGRLVHISDAARSNEGRLASFAFEDADAGISTSAQAFVDEMRLQKVVQRIWMTDLGRELALASPWQTEIGETHGQALLNAQAALRSPTGFAVGLQLQGRSLKIFCAPHPYPRSATREQHAAVEAILETLRRPFALGSTAKPSGRRTRGFRSFTVATLPPGRAASEWLAILRPHFDRLVEAFPAGQLTDASAIASLHDEEG